MNNSHHAELNTAFSFNKIRKGGAGKKKQEQRIDQFSRLFWQLMLRLYGDSVSSFGFVGINKVR